MISSEAGIIITGASRGIGAAMARYFAKVRKNPLLLIGRNTNRLSGVADICRDAGCAVYILPADISDEHAVKRLQLPDGFKPAVLINNAGVYIQKNLAAASFQDYANQFNSNVLTAVAATDRFLPLILDNRPGLIVNICSVASLAGIERSPAYAVSKHGLLGYTRSLRVSLAGKNVAVTAINLGATASDSWQGEDRALETLIDPVDVARIINTLMNLSVRGVVEEILISPPVQGQTREK
jgi:short-subunit dehydrogenase